MISVKLMGGLGNQMFQYAVGRHLAILHDTNLILDTSFLNSRQSKCTVRQYELDNLSINASTGSNQEIFMAQYNLIGGSKLWIARLKNLAGITLSPPNLIKEKGFSYNRKILSSKDNCYLKGYWQSEKYFIDIKEQLYLEFNPKTPLRDGNLEIAESMKNFESVSVHVRRGDYISDSKTADFHGHCSINYYQLAFEAINERITNPHFYLFSDDIEWVKNNLQIPGPVTYVDNNSDHGYEDIRLMSTCNHHIIANSSFSWWGAWLGKNPDKIVIAPSRWFKAKDINTQDLLPSNWYKLDNS